MPFEIRFLLAYDMESLAAELRRIAQITGKNTVTTRDITRFGRVNASTIYGKFGSIANANEAAGLSFNRIRRLTNLEILRTLVDLWNRTLREEGRRPLRSDVRKYGLPFSCDVVIRRFGTWKNALIAANSLSDTEPDRPSVERRRRRRINISLHRRYQVFKRDGYVCRICKRENEPLEVDHIVPVCKGGGDEMENLQTLCWDCNRGKGGNLQ